MTHQAVVRRYAQALYEEARREPRVAEDMKLLRASLEASRDLNLCLESPVIARKKKLSVLEALFSERLRPLSMRFLRLVLVRKRENLLRAITHAFQERKDKESGILSADARVSLTLSTEEESRLQAVLERKLDKRIRLRTARDPDIVGGVIVRIGDTVYDGSVHHQLSQLRRRMIAEA